MKEFRGFPARTEFTPVPNGFFSALLPEIDDIDELKVTLHVITTLYRKKGYPRYVAFSELLGNTALVRSLRHGENTSEEALRIALGKAVDRGTLLRAMLEQGKAAGDVFLLNDEPGRQALEKIEKGEMVLAGLKREKQPAVEAEEPPDIFTLYEQNIGLLTPMVADELKEMEKLYPAEWIRDAVREAVLHNKRNIRYIAKILENWSVEGRGDGTHRRDSEKRDPDKYIKGKYGHMVQR